MTKPMLPKSPRQPRRSRTISSKAGSQLKTSRKKSGPSENSDVLISAVISSYLLTHLHHVLQRAEYFALQEGRAAQSANFAQLRKVLCMDARSMKDACAMGLKDGDFDQLHDSNFGSKVA